MTRCFSTVKNDKGQGIRKMILQLEIPDQARPVPNTRRGNFFPKHAVSKYQIFREKFIFVPKFHNQNSILMHF